MFKMDLTELETQALINLIDIAVKTAGLQVAETAVVLIKKIQDVSKIAEEKETT